MLYAPPLGNNCDIEFTGAAYTPPTGNAVAINLVFDIDAIRNVFIDNITAYGTPRITLLQTVNAIGIGATPTGEPYVRRVWNLVYPSGFTSYGVGSPIPVYRQYVYPDGIAPSWWVPPTSTIRYIGQYSPPPGESVVLEFGANYVAPPGDPLIIEMGATGAGRIPWVSLNNTSRYGTPTVQNQFYPVFAYGERYVEFGTPSISSLGRQLVQTNPWWQPPHFAAGTPTVVNVSKGVWPGGIAAPTPQFSNTHWISFWTRVLSPAGLAPGTVEDPIVTHEIQLADQAGQGCDTSVFGTSSFTHFLREIQPPWIASNVFGRPLVGRATYVEVEGLPEPEAMFGSPIVTHDGQFVYTDAPVSIAEYGLPTIRNDRLYITFTDKQSWVSSFVEFPVTYNKTQLLLCGPYEDQLLGGKPPDWFGPIYVENRNKVLAPDGKPQQKFGYTYIWNAASPVFPAGIDSFTPKGISDTFISYVNREVLPEPWDSFFNTRWSVVWNSARPLSASPLAPSTSWGSATVINANRFIRLAAIDNQALGTAFIADRIRTVYPRPMWDAPTAFPDVRINPYPITAPGIFGTAFGSASAIIHWTIFWPKGIKPKDIQCGEPVVENQFKTVNAWPWNSEWYGVLYIKNKITYSDIGGYDFTLFGATDISYRTKRISPMGAAPPPIVHIHRIRNLLPDLPAVQRIFLPHDSSVYGQTQFGALWLPFVTVIPSAYNDVGEVGTPIVSTNMLLPRSFFLEQDGPQLGVPTLIFTRFLRHQSRSYDNPDSEVGRPRITPHTIYGPLCRITQAIINHPSSQHYVQSEAQFHANGNNYPAHRISLLNRIIYPDTTPFWYYDGDYNSITDARYGTPEIFNKNRTIQARGFYSQRMPIPMFLNVPQWITFDEYNTWPPSLAFGTAHVAPPPAQQPAPYANPVGSNMTLWGVPRVELFIRSVTATGIPHKGTNQFSPINYRDNPVTTNHQVGYHRSRYIEGSDFTIWGTAWISNYIREFQFDGFDALLMDFWQTKRSDRMHLTLINPPKSAVGIPSSLVFGTTWVSCGTRYIEPQGRDWSYFTPFGVAQSIAAQGFESMEVGDVDKWEEGKLKPHGDDLSSVGEPHMAQTITPDSNDVSDFGTSALSFILTCWGFPPVGFDGPVVTNPDGCGLRYTIPGGVDATVFGVASIT